MILGIGIDSVEVHRFAQWPNFSHKKLSRIFSNEEIEYCLQQQNKSAERFAARFAAREAFFKAFSSAFPEISIPFLTLCKHSCVIKQNNRPLLIFNWQCIPTISLSDASSCAFHLSLTHTDSTATAFMIIEKKI